LTNRACLDYLGCNDSSKLISKICEFSYKQGTAQYPDSKSLGADIFHYIRSMSHDLADFGQVHNNDKAFHWLGQKTTWNSKPAVVFVIKDITDVLNLERTQVESRFKNVLLRSVSHELKTPTNGILHSVQAILRERDVSPFAKEKLEIAEVSSKHLLLLIGDLLDFSQLLSSKFSLSLSNFNIRKLLSECVELMRLIADKKKLRLVKHFDPLLPETIYSDSNRLSQVMLNLLSNAVKFTPKRGKIEVRALLTDSMQMEISVTDNGIGISPENFSKLYHSFGRIENSILINPQGTGLGLHISNMLAKQLGEKPISLKSKPSEGSCFSFIVNIGNKVNRYQCQLSETSTGEYDGLDEISSAQKVYSFKLRSRRLPPVLVVDDSPFNRCIITDILALANIECAEASTGKEAFEYVVRRAHSDKPVKVVVMDFEMPEMNGPTACIAIHKHLQELGLQLPKVIAHTAYSSDEDIRICREAGMIDYLAKPSPREVILSTIGKHLLL